MKILALDTSTNYLSIAIVDGCKTVAKLHKKADMMHSTLLVPMIDRLLKKASLKLSDIGCFAIGIGPGSFTGLRIGVATVKGLAYSTKKPIVAVPTFDAIAENAKEFKGVICPVLDARKNKVYACLYRSDGSKIKRVSKYLLAPASEIIPILSGAKDSVACLGDGCGLVQGGGSEIFPKWHPKAETIARLGLEYVNKRKFVKPRDLEPMYLYSRECDIKGI